MITPAPHVVWAIYRDRDAPAEGMAEWWADLVLGWDEAGVAYVSYGCGPQLQSCAETAPFQMLVADISKRTATPAVQRAIAEALGHLPEDS